MSASSGLDWTPLPQYLPIDKNATPEAWHIVFSGACAAHGGPHSDEHKVLRPDEENLLVRRVHDGAFVGGICRGLKLAAQE